MKEGWKYERLGDVATYINGFAFKPDDWSSNGIPIIRIQNLTDSSRAFNYCSREDVPLKFYVDDGDILISWSATLGVFEWCNGKALLNQHIFKVIFNKMEINKQYFKYAIYMSIDEMSKHTNGATMKHIRKGDFDNIRIPIPPLPEQERIVSLLDAEFAKIDAIKANAEKQLKDAKALFQSALKDYLTPKEGWSYNSFNEIYAIKMGKTPPRADKSMWDVNKETDNLWVSVADITSNEGRDIVSTKEHISECAAQKMHIVPQGSLLMSFKLTIGKMAFAGKNLYTNEAIIAIPDDGCYKLRFLYYYLSSYNWDTLTVGAEKVKGKTLNKSSISRIKLPIISLSDQQQIAEQLDKISAKIHALQSNFDTTVTLCNDLKQSILKDIFG